MYKSHRDSFVIQINRSSNSEDDDEEEEENLRNRRNRRFINTFSSMKLFGRFRKIVMRLIFAFPSRDSSHGMAAHGGPVPRRRSCDRPEPPKTSCSSYYTSSAHYSEAISDCIEFCNKSLDEGVLHGRKSDVMV